MKTIIINGGPRKEWNTAQLLRSAQKGAEAAGAENHSPGPAGIASTHPNHAEAVQTLANEGFPIRYNQLQVQETRSRSHEKSSLTVCEVRRFSYHWIRKKDAFRMKCVFYRNGK